MSNLIKPLTITERTLFFDTETTGLGSDAEICEISIIDYQCNKVLDSLIKPSKPIPADATAIHGITNEMVAHAPTFGDLAHDIWMTIGSRPTVIYNADYDTRLLIQCAKLNKLDPACFYTIKSYAACAMLWYSGYRKEPGKFGNSYKWHKLVDACAHENIDISGITAHRAYADCLMTLELVKTVNNKILGVNNKMSITENSLVTCNAFPGVGRVSSLHEKSKTAMVIFDNLPSDKIKAIPIADLKLATDTVENTKQWEVVPEYHKASLPVVLNLENDAVTTAPSIKFDKAHYIAVIDKMELEGITPGFIKSIKDAAIKVDKALYAPIKAWRDTVDEVIAHAERRVADLKAKAAQEELNRKAEKKAHVAKIITEMKGKIPLPVEYLDKILLKDEYLNKTMTDKKIIDDLTVQFDTQIALKKGADDALALKAANTKNREMLINKLNVKYGFKYTYADFMVESFDDEYVESEYARIAEAKRQEEHQKKLREEAKAQPITLPGVAKPAEPLLDLPDIPGVGLPDPIIEQIIEQNANPIGIKMVYKNLKLGAISQMAIMAAVAQLKKIPGLSVEFVE